MYPISFLPFWGWFGIYGLWVVAVGYFFRVPFFLGVCAIAHAELWGSWRFERYKIKRLL
jgi:hypothetical protein|tara:strand:- start:251 stop:427 length:177 start_codon:yes stop_codon:yes gene_type:complete